MFADNVARPELGLDVNAWACLWAVNLEEPFVAKNQSLGFLFIPTNEVRFWLSSSDALTVKPGKGHLKVTSHVLWDPFMSCGNFTCCADWHFIYWDCLNCLLLNSVIHYGNHDKRCRRCRYESKTLLPTLCGCKPYTRAWQLTHHAVQDELMKAISKTGWYWWSILS